MLTVLQAATYISDRYLREYGEPIEEKKLQKLMYFAQRESIIQNGAPMFEGEFRALQTGPYLPSLHLALIEGPIHEPIIESEYRTYQSSFDKLFELYSRKTIQSLIGHCHCELSWKKARIGYSEYEPSDTPMALSDIYEDAENANKWRHEVMVKRRLQPILDQYRSFLRNVSML